MPYEYPNPGEVILAGTGHRPTRLGLGYDKSSRESLRLFAIENIQRLREEGLNIVDIVSGMAQGWDQALAEAAIELELNLIAAVPFVGMEAKWPADAKKRFSDILAKAKWVANVCDPGYAAWKFIKRDHWMVNHCTHLLALWDGSQAGGTWQTVNYAMQDKSKPVINLWDRWSARGR